MQKESIPDFSPLRDEAAMAQLAYSRWELSEAESMAEYVSRRRTVDLATLVRQVVEEELSPAQQTAIRLRYGENLLPIEIARRLHVNKSVVVRTLERAEAHIQNHLKYAVQYQYNLRHVPFLPLAVREAMVVAAAQHGAANASSNLQRLRIRENLTLNAVSDATHIPCDRLSELENGTSLPDAHELLQLSSFYGVCADSILKGEPSCKRS